MGMLWDVDESGAVVVVLSVRREARCSCNWKAESTSCRSRGDGPVLMSLDLDPGRIRRVMVAVVLFVGGAGVVAGGAAFDMGLLGTAGEVGEPSI